MSNVYILKSVADGSYYVGSCRDLKDRLSQHNKGQVRSTKRGLPWKIVYTELHNTMSIARKRELEIKSWKKRRSIETLIDISKF